MATNIHDRLAFSYICNALRTLPLLKSDYSRTVLVTWSEASPLHAISCHRRSRGASWCHTLNMGSFLSNYRDWLKVADTALPQNLFGYLLQYSLGPFRADPFTILPYDDPQEIARCGSNGAKSFLPEKLPEREGPRPEMIQFMAPNRQVSQLTGDDMHQVFPSGPYTSLSDFYRTATLNRS